jgi:hypothetical protein
MQRSSTPIPEPSPSQAPSPLRTALPLPQALHDYSMRHDHLRMVRSTGLGTQQRTDGLDRFLLSCARDAILVSDLLARLPCSRQASAERMDRLLALGLLAQWSIEGLDEPRQEEGPEAHERDTVRPRPSSGP